MNFPDQIKTEKPHMTSRPISQAILMLFMEKCKTALNANVVLNEL
jgi:hypothetical protein